jgi:outer membrane protein OmpA-like peptidoglycan-associated protein
VDRAGIPALANVALAAAVVAGLAVSGCATRGVVTGEVREAEARLDERLAQLDRRLGQLEAALREQGERLGRIEAAGADALARAAEAGRRAEGAAAAAAGAAARADQAASAAAEARRGAAQATETAGRALDRAGVVEARVARQAAARQADPGGDTVTVSFAFDRWTLDARAQAVLGDLLKRLVADPALLVTLEGYTDSVGTDGYNFELSRKRAEAVRRFIVDGGVGVRRIEHIGFGETHPAADNATAGGRARNRRVVIKLVPAE